MVSEVPPSSVSPAFPAPHRIRTYLVDGLHAVVGMITMLRSRSYRVIDLSAEIHDDVMESSIECTVMLRADDLGLLLKRVRRLPSVVSCERI